MATHSKTGQTLTLEQFVRWPRINEKSYLEYHEGRVEARMSGTVRQSVLMSRMTSVIDRYATSAGLGMALCRLRCTFGDRSIVGDVVSLRLDQIQRDDDGRIVDDSNFTPELLVEIRSPEESVEKIHAKLIGAIKDGCSLAWLIDPDLRTIDIFRWGIAIERLSPDGFLDGAPVLPGFRLAVAEVFGWLKYRRAEPGQPGAEPR